MVLSRDLCRSLAVLLANFVLCQAFAQGQVLGPLDDFEDGTTMGWGHETPASPNPPQNIATDGPQAADDNYLRVTATGSLGPGSKLLITNSDQWAGNYFTNGINSVTADVRNPNAFPLSMRLAFRSGTSFLYSSQAILVQPGTGWQSIEIPITQDSITGIASFQTVLSTVAHTRILHNAAATHRGADVAGEFHIDNIQIHASADFTLDGLIDGGDLARWASAFGGTAADVDLDGNTDGADLLEWQRQLTPIVVAVLTVPEPAGAALALLAMSCWTLIRRGC